MSTTLDEQINQLKQTIADIESQRSILGDEAVEASLKPIHQKLADFQALAESQRKEPFDVPQRKRKLVTLLYMDVVGSTAMTHDLDPEDSMDILDKAVLRLAAPIEAHGGHVTRYTGDGFKAIFGDPIAREDDPEQAIRAGLEILDISKAVAEEIEKEWDIEDFQVRIGIDTGLAAIGGLTEAEETIKGRVVNLAVRIESAAPPGGLLISHNTYRHIRGVFNVEPQEPISAKGFPDPVPVYLVRELKPRAFRVQTRGVEGVETRMVGRETELKYLQDALLTAIEEGEGQVVTICGEAGVGKSRLLYEFQNWIELQPPIHTVRFFQGRGRQEARGLPYSLLRDLFAFRFQVLDDDTGEQARQKIEAGFCELFGEDDDGIMRAHILGQLLGFDFSDSPHLKGVMNDPEQLRNRARMYLVGYFQELVKEIPVVIFLEDLHWADDSSLDMVMHLGEFTPQFPLLVVGAARPALFERRPFWGEGQVFHKQLALHPLSKRESRQLVAEILKFTADIPPELRELIVGGAEGNPFYLEELIKMLIEDGVVVPGEETWEIDLTRLEEADVPATLAGVLQARLDSLPPQERTVLQQASVVGRLFWDRIVTYIQAEAGNGGDPHLIPHALTSLRNRELVYRHEESAFIGAVEYLFKHDVLREVTYESVPKNLRKTYHGLVADWLILNIGDRIEEYSGLIAKHLLLAENRDLACEYFFQAGEVALISYANIEAERFFQQALELTPPDPLLANILSGLGYSSYRLGKLHEASEFLEKAIILYREFGDLHHLANTYARLSKLFWHSNHLNAWKTCLKGLDEMQDAPESLGYATLLAEAGRMADFRRETNQIIPFCERALEMAKSIGSLEVEIEASITLALHWDNQEESISILENMIDLAESNDLLHPAARAHRYISRYLFYIDLKSAVLHIIRAAKIYKHIGETDSMLNALNLVADFYTQLGEMKIVEPKLIELLQSSTVPASHLNDLWSRVRRLLYTMRGEWNSALDATRKLAGIYKSRDHIDMISEINMILAFIILEMNRFEHLEDLSEAKQALKENHKINPLHWQTSFYMAFVFARLGQISKAQEMASKTLENEVYDKDDLWYRISLSQLDFELAFQQKQWSQAILASKKTLGMRPQSHYWRIARNLIDLGDALIGRNEPGDLETARETYQQSLDMFTEMGAPGYIKVLEERLGNM